MAAELHSASVQFAALVEQEDDGQHDWHDEAANRSKEEEEEYLRRSQEEASKRAAGDMSPGSEHLTLAERIRQQLLTQESFAGHILARRAVVAPEATQGGGRDSRAHSRNSGATSRGARSDGTDSRLEGGVTWDAALGSDDEDDEQRRHEARRKAHHRRLEEVRKKRNEECERHRDHAQSTIDDSELRSQIAMNRRDFLSVSERLTRLVMWRTVFVSYLFARRACVARLLHMARFTLITRVIPMLRLRIRVKWRKLKNAQLMNDAALPRATVDDLRSDNILVKFPLEQLVNAHKTLSPVYHSAGEFLMYQGSEGHELYVLVQGTVQIIIEEVQLEVDEATGKECKVKTRNVVATVPARKVLGTIGMITGEARMASIRCLTDCVFWSLTRRNFHAAAVNSDNSDARVAKDAMAEVTALHESNMVSIYKGFKPETLLKYPTFAGTSLEARRMILDQPRYKVYHHGDYFMHGGVAATQAYFILRGAVTIMWPGGSPPNTAHFQHAKIQTLETSMREGTFNIDPHTAGGVPGYNRPDSMGRLRNLTEVIPALVDIPDLKFAPRNAALEKMMGRPNRPFITLAAPLVLGFRHITFRDLPEVDVVAATNCDVIVIKHDITLNMALKEAASVMAIRRRLNLAYAECQTPPSPPDLLVLALQQIQEETLRLSVAAQVSRRATWHGSVTGLVLEENESVTFRPGTRDVYFFLSGRVEDPAYRNLDSPYLWPTLTDAFFGTNVSTAIVSRKALVFKVSRRDFVALFRNLLKEPIIEQVATELRDRFVRMMGRDPTFDGDGLPVVSNLLALTQRRKTVVAVGDNDTSHDTHNNPAHHRKSQPHVTPHTQHSSSSGTSSPRHGVSISDAVDERHTRSDSDEEESSDSIGKMAPHMRFAPPPPAAPVVAPAPPKVDDPLADVVRHVKSFHKGGLSPGFASSMHQMMVSNAIARQLNNHRAVSISSFGSAESDQTYGANEQEVEHVVVDGVRLPRTLTLRDDTQLSAVESHRQSIHSTRHMSHSALFSASLEQPEHLRFAPQVDPASFIREPPRKPQFVPSMPAFAGLVLKPGTIAKLQPTGTPRQPELKIGESHTVRPRAPDESADLLAKRIGLQATTTTSNHAASRPGLPQPDIRTPLLKRTLPVCLETITAKRNLADEAVALTLNDRQTRLDALLATSRPPDVVALTSASTRAIAWSLELHFAEKLAAATSTLSARNGRSTGVAETRTKQAKTARKR